MGALKTEIRRMRLADLRPQTVNARYMRKEQFDQLVANIKRDGVLTSVPLIYQPPGAEPEILSGHHRVAAALTALGSDVEADVMVVLDEQSKQEIIARQLSHNSIAGEDDPATLKQLYDQLEDVDWRSYAGLDDKTLALLDEVDLTGLSEVNLDFSTVVLVFLPHELERATAALTEAKKALQASERWVAPLPEYERTLDALQSAHVAWNVGNVAAALGVILDVYEAHLTDLRDGFLTPDGEAKTPSKPAPIEALIGTRSIPSDAAAVINKAVEKMVRAGDVNEDARWKALELWAADYLAG